MLHLSFALIATILFSLALVLHFSAKQFERLAIRHPRHTRIFHRLGKVEVAFCSLSISPIFCMATKVGTQEAHTHAQSH